MIISTLVAQGKTVFPTADFNSLGKIILGHIATGYGDRYSRDSKRIRRFQLWRKDWIRSRRQGWDLTCKLEIEDIIGAKEEIVSSGENYMHGNSFYLLVK